MFSLALFLTLTAVAFASPLDDSLNSYWHSWKAYHSKQFSNNDDDYLRRLIWEKNVKYINRHNLEYSLGQHTYTLAMNQFGHMTHEEFLTKMTPKHTTTNYTRSGITFMPPLNMEDLPETVDWRDKGYVTPVKNQEDCGSCWAFSTTGSLEGQHFRATGNLVSLSEQNLVDCADEKYGNDGCQGGWMDSSFTYIKENGGIDTEESYPYKAQGGDCHYKKESRGAGVTGFVDIAQYSESDLQKAVATVGPISVAIDAGLDSFQFYSSGIYNENYCSSTVLDHAVLAVGYGTQNGQDYWLVKNSWSENWGIKGYILMSRNKNNQCGIASKASYPTV